jgi:hypothetical protein
VILSTEEATAAWISLREFQWVPQDSILLKVPLTPAAVPSLYEHLKDSLIHVSGGGNVAYLVCPHDTYLPGDSLTLRGATPLFVAPREESKIAQAMKQALDPMNRFPSFDD